MFVSRFDSLSFMTDNGPQEWLYIAAGILFLLPCLLLCFAWWSSFRSENPTTLPTWRNNLVKVALLVAGVSTLIHILWNASWLHSGGSPHGMGAGPGIWHILADLCCGRLPLPYSWAFSQRVKAESFSWHGPCQWCLFSTGFISSKWSKTLEWPPLAKLLATAVRA